MKHRICYALYLAVSCSAALLLRDRYSIALFVTLLLLPVFSALSGYFASRRLHVTQFLSKETAVKGQAVEYELRLQNTGMLFCPHLRIHCFRSPCFAYSKTPETIFSLAPRSQKSLACTVECRLRGRCEIGCERVEVWDFLRLFRFAVCPGSPKRILIHPRIRPVDRFKVAQTRTQQETALLRRQEEDYTTVSDFADYTEQDSIKKVHWKLSAKRQELIVKKYASYDDCAAAVVLNLCAFPAGTAQPERVADSMLECAVSMVHRAVQLGYGIDFLYNTDRAERLRVQNSSQFARVYALGAMLEFGSPVALEKLLEQSLCTAGGPVSLFILTAALSPSLCRQVSRLTAAGYSVTVLDFRPAPARESDAPAFYKELKNAGAAALPADEYLDIA